MTGLKCAPQSLSTKEEDRGRRKVHDHVVETQHARHGHRRSGSWGRAPRRCRQPASRQLSQKVPRVLPASRNSAGLGTWAGSLSGLCLIGHIDLGGDLLDGRMDDCTQHSYRWGSYEVQVPGVSHPALFSAALAAR